MSAKDGNAKEPQHTTSARSQPHPIRAQSALQDHIGGDVRHIRQVRRHTSDPSGHDTREQRHGVRCLRGHFRRQERVRSPVRLQRVQSLSSRLVSSAREVGQEDRRREGEGRDTKDKAEIWNLVM